MSQKRVAVKERPATVQIHNSVLQHPMCFPQTLEKEGYKIKNNKHKIKKSDADYPPFLGRVVKTNKGAYCLGYALELDSDEGLIMACEIVTWKLPSKFDLKILYGLIGLLESERSTMQYTTMYSLLKALDLPTDKYYYKKLKKSLFKWRYINIHYFDAFRQANSSRFRRHASMSIISAIDFHDSSEIKRGFVSVEFCKAFLDVIQGITFTTVVDPTIVAKLNSESSINLLLYLESFSMKFDAGEILKRKFRAFAELTLSCRENERPYRVKNQIETAIEKINSILEDKQYSIVFAGDVVKIKRKEKTRQLS